MFQHASGMLVARRIATKKASAEGREAHRDQKRTMVARRIATKNALIFSRSRVGSDRVIRTVKKIHIPAARRDEGKSLGGRGTGTDHRSAHFVSENRSLVEIQRINMHGNTMNNMMFISYLID